MAGRETKYEPTKDDIFVIAAAMLTSIGFTQTQIEKDLGIGQSLVSVLINKAKDKGWLAKYLPNKNI